jgi:hypothetical protein
MRSETTTHPNGWAMRTFARPENAEPFLVERHTEDANAVHHEVRVYVAGKLAATAASSKPRGTA